MRPWVIAGGKKSVPWRAGSAPAGRIAGLACACEFLLFPRRGIGADGGPERREAPAPCGLPGRGAIWRVKDGQGAATRHTVSAASNVATPQYAPRSTLRLIVGFGRQSKDCASSASLRSALSCGDCSFRLISPTHRRSSAKRKRRQRRAGNQRFRAGWSRLRIAQWRDCYDPMRFPPQAVIGGSSMAAPAGWRAARCSRKMAGVEEK